MQQAPLRMDFSGEKMQLLLPQEEIFFWTHLPGHTLFFIIGPHAVVMSAFCSKMVFCVLCPDPLPGASHVCTTGDVV